MSRADRHREDLVALLYIPDEALVRTTIEGNDADWSDTLSYVPTDRLVDKVLQSSRRERPRFRLPSSLEPRAVRDGESLGLARASALFTLIGTSPLSLAAATAAHIAIFAAIAPWVAGKVRTASTIEWPYVYPVAAERIVYLAPTAHRSRAIVRPTPRPPRPRPAAQTREPDTVAIQRPSRGWSATSDSGPRTNTLEQPPSSRDAEVAAALHQEFRLTGDGLAVEQFDVQRFELLVRVLALRPRVRLLVRGAGPRQRGERDTEPAVAGMREAEAFKHLLVGAGISSERIDVDAMAERDGNRPCPEQEPMCAAGRSRVQTMLAAPGAGRP